jgi:predicted cupin superfamily sugar epimerase
MHPKPSTPAEEWIRHLGLRQHPEGGYFAEVYRARETIESPALPARFEGARTFSTSIYYLLQSGDFSAFHRIKSDELWHFYSGSPLHIHMLDQHGLRTTTIGGEACIGMNLQFSVPHGTWFAAEVSQPDSFALTGCTVSPGFDYEDFEMARRSDLLAEFPEFEREITRLTRQ